MTGPERPQPAAAPRAVFACAGLRVGLVAAALALWFWTQSLIGKRPCPPGGIGDRLLEWSGPLNAWLLERPAWADTLLVSSSALIDAVGLFLLGLSILGPSIRPFLAMLVVFALRQACQALCALPAPEGMIWRDPGVPSLFVTYGVSTDLFFSGHTSLAVLGAIELARAGRRWLLALGIAIALFEASAVLALRAHYTLDVFTGVVAALWSHAAASRLAPSCDRILSRLTRRG